MAVSERARGDWEDLRAEGLEPTLEDFDRLNRLANRLEDGAETTCANFPRIGWAGDVPFYQPTLAAFAWYHGVAERLAANDETANTFWFFALAHAREPRFFDALHGRDEIEVAVKAWVETLPVTRDEVVRACRYAVTGFDDAKPAEPDDGGNPRFRASRSAAAENLRRVEDQLVKACAALKCPPDALLGETQTRLDRLCEAAAVELGRPMSRDEARLRAEYDLTYREITLRLRAERKSAQGEDKRDGDADGGEGVRDDIPPVAGAEPARLVAGGAPGQEPEEAVVVAHGGKYTKSGDGGQG